MLCLLSPFLIVQSINFLLQVQRISSIRPLELGATLSQAAQGLLLDRLPEHASLLLPLTRHLAVLSPRLRHAFLMRCTSEYPLYVLLPEIPTILLGANNPDTN